MSKELTINSPLDLGNAVELITKQVQIPAVMEQLIRTTFKGIEESVVPQAIVDGMMRGFTFKDFLNKKVYAIGYGKSYAIVQAIDHLREVATKGGVCGTSKPEYVEKDGNIISCSIAVQKITRGKICDYWAEVYFDEYYNGHKNPDGSIKKIKCQKNGQIYYYDMKPTSWDTKPRTMIAKCAEAAALRKACKALSGSYIEEEMQKVVDEKIQNQNQNNLPSPFKASEAEIAEGMNKLNDVKTYEELQVAWLSFTPTQKMSLRVQKDEIKNKFLTIK